MDRNRLAALVALAFLGAGAWWMWQRARVPAQAGEGGAWWPELAAPVMDAVQAVSDVAVDVVNAVKPGPWSPPAKAEPYLAMVYAAEDAAGAPRNLFARQLWQESRFNPKAFNAASGAKGIAQFMDATAAEWGVDPWDPASAIDGMGRYMAWLYGQTGDWKTALAAYNWGIGNVKRKGLDQAPAETLAYVADIGGAVGLA